MKNIFPVFALAVMFFFCGSILFKVKETFTKENQKIIFNESIIFANAVKEKLQIKAEHKIFKAKDYSNKGISYSRIKRKIERYATDYLPFRQPIVQAAFLVDFHLGNKILPNRVVDLGEGYLTVPTPKDSFSLQSIDAFVEKMSYFKHILDSLGIPLVYASYPRVISSKDEISKTGKDQSIQAKNELVQKLRNTGIPVIALHNEFPRSLFYKTDHHWQAKTTILAGQMISEKLNELYDFNLETELLDTANFTEIYVKKWLGSSGEKVIPLYPKEDFYIYSPKYPTDINWLLLRDRKLFESQGNFDSLYHFLPESGEGKNVYAVAYPSFSFSENENLPDGKKILLIGDSFNMPLSKFLALVFKEVNFIYRRSSLLDDYLANKPDIVVVGFGSAAIREPLESLLF